jgi:hypothetical protein
MPKTFYPYKDAELKAWGKHLEETLSQNQQVYEISEESLNKLKEAQKAYSDKLTDQHKAIAAAKAATTGKNLARNELIKAVSLIVKRMHNSRQISGQMLLDAGISIHQKKTTRVLPVVPTNLTANGNDDNSITLHWQDGGNKPRTMYTIEAMIGDSDKFVMLDTIQITKYKHEGIKAGIPVIYRVYARRSGKESSASNEAAVYMD